jgi:two-component system, cell cycle response regulator
MGLSEGKASRPSPGNVLVVDDSRLVRAMVTRYLESAHYEVEEADNGATALEMLARKSYDVVITDLSMPKLDGFEVLAAVKRLAPTVEVIILTGADPDVHSAVRALRLGAHDYVTKPPSSADFVVFTVQQAVEKKRLQEANEHLLHQLEALGRTDGLTGVANRRAFDEALEKETLRARRYKQDLGLVLLDIDHFKKINDAYGHPGGDEVLRWFARTAAGALREGDVLYRYGGEEFAAILPETGLHDATQVAERFRKAVQQAASAPNVTISIGVACYPEHGATSDQLIAAADAALYRAKDAGKNCVKVAVAG